MCASCSCGCKPGKPEKGCKCTCKMCREARTMSVEKNHLIRKAHNGFEAIADAILDDVYDDDLVVDDEGNVYALVGEIEKGERSKANRDKRIAMRNQQKFVSSPSKLIRSARPVKGKDTRQEYMSYIDDRRAADARYIMAPTVNRKNREAKRRDRSEARAMKRGDVKKAYLVPVELIEKGLPSVARQAMRPGGGGWNSLKHGGALQYRVAANESGQRASKLMNRNEKVKFGESLDAGRYAKQGFKQRAGLMSEDRGRIGGEYGKRNLAAISAKRQARQTALADVARRNAQQTGRGVLP